MIFSVLFTWRGGVVNQALRLLGLISKDIYWTGKPWPARILYEAAELDGANGFQRHVYITLPMLKNVIRFVVLTSSIGLLQLFDELYNLFSGTATNAQVLVGGPRNAALTTVWYMYDKGFGSVVELGYASAIAYGLFIVILVLTVIINKALEGRRSI